METRCFRAKGQITWRLLEIHINGVILGFFLSQKGTRVGAAGVSSFHDGSSGKCGAGCSLPILSAYMSQVFVLCLLLL